MNLFTKATIESILTKKVLNKELKNYHIYDNKIFIQKSKRSNATIDTRTLTEDEIIKLMIKKTPDVSRKNIKDFYKQELNGINQKQTR
jgi:hypothetical protein